MPENVYGEANKNTLRFIAKRNVKTGALKPIRISEQKLSVECMCFTQEYPQNTRKGEKVSGYFSTFVEKYPDTFLQPIRNDAEAWVLIL